VSCDEKEGIMIHMHSRIETPYSEEHFFYTKFITQVKEADLTNGQISYNPQTYARIKIKWARILLAFATIIIIIAWIWLAGT
jgi:hypothetical protein